MYYWYRQASLGEQIFNYCANDLDLLIRKTNARRHARREKNATMLRGGGGGGERGAKNKP